MPLRLLQTACFVAGTSLLTPFGEKAIEEFRVGDEILSRSESDADGPLAVKVVERTFTRKAPIISVQVGGQEIQTTGEHPFFVRGKGWIMAKEMTPGDQLSSHDGTWVTVENVTDLKEIAIVYNLSVSDYHTYFVGSSDWGFSVWAHNAAYDWFVHEGVVVLRNAQGQFIRTGYTPANLASISTARPSPNISRPGRWEITAFIGFFVC